MSGSTAVCVPSWIAAVALILLGGSGGIDAVVRLVELRRGR
jgi:hypothetical protein